MNERPQGLSRGEALEQLLREAFPDLRCLRCGNDSFALTYDLESQFSSAAQTRLLAAAADLKPEEVSNLRGEMVRELLDSVFITLVCERCRMVERHLRPTLERSERPIKIDIKRDVQL